jgi:DNA-binding NarL/FixJ family response regulator
MPITVSIVEDDRETRESLDALFSREPNLRYLRSYATGEAAVRGMIQEPPDVALVDINLPGMSGIECVAQLKERLPDLQVLMLTMYDESGLIFESLRAGASGYLLKKMIPSELIHAVEEVHAGGAPMSIRIARKVVAHFHRIRKPRSDMELLTTRELEILTLLANGCFYKEISEKLGVTLSTVKRHVEHIYRKLHVQSRTEATRKFLARDD